MRISRIFLSFTVLLALLFVSLDFRIISAMPLQEEIPQLQMVASGDSSDMESDSSADIVNNLGSGVSNVEDAVVSSGDIDDINTNTSARSNNPLAKASAESQVETETSSGDVASEIDSSVNNADNGKESSEPNTKIQSLQKYVPQQSSLASQTAQQRDKTPNIEEDNRNDDEKETESDENQLVTLNDSEKTPSSNTTIHSLPFQYNDKQKQLNKTKDEGRAYQFLNANGEIQSFSKADETEKRINNSTTEVKFQSTNPNPEAFGNYVMHSMHAPQNMDGLSTNRQYTQVLPSREDAYSSFSAPAQNIAQTSQTPTQSLDPFSLSSQNDSPPVPQNQNLAEKSQSSYVQSNPVLGNVQSNFAEQNPSNPRIQETESSQDFQFVNPNQNTAKLSYSQQPNTRQGSSFEFAEHENNPPVNVNYADHAHTPENTFYSDQSQNSDLSIAGQGQGAEGIAIANQQPSTFREIVCKDLNKRISCAPGQQINILNANYGSMGQSQCSFNNAPSAACQTPGTYELVKSKCDGQQSCDLMADDQEFGDHCPADDKYLDVNYGCSTAPSPQWNNFYQYDFAPVPNNEELEDDDDASGSENDDENYNIIQPQSFTGLMPYQAQPSMSYGSFAAPLPQPYYPQPAPLPQPYYPQPGPAPYPQQTPGVPDLMTTNAYSAPVPPNPCDSCNTCSTCAMSHCTSQCQSTCHPLQCSAPPTRLPPNLLPLWEKWDEKTANMNAMEMSALVISPVPKLHTGKAKKPEKKFGSKKKQESEKRSKISRKPSNALSSSNKLGNIKKSSSSARKKALTGSKKSFHPSELRGFRVNDPSQSKDTGSGMLESEIRQGFTSSNGFEAGSGDAGSGSKH